MASAGKAGASVGTSEIGAAAAPEAGSTGVLPRCHPPTLHRPRAAGSARQHRRLRQQPTGSNWNEPLPRRQNAIRGADRCGQKTCSSSRQATRVVLKPLAPQLRPPAGHLRASGEQREIRKVGRTPACAAAPSPDRCARRAPVPVRHGRAAPCCRAPASRRPPGAAPAGLQRQHRPRWYRAHPERPVPPPSAAADLPPPRGCRSLTSPGRVTRRPAPAVPHHRVPPALRSSGSRGCGRPHPACRAHQLQAARRRRTRWPDR